MRIEKITGSSPLNNKNIGDEDETERRRLAAADLDKKNIESYRFKKDTNITPEEFLEQTIRAGKKGFAAVFDEELKKHEDKE